MSALVVTVRAAFAESVANQRAFWSQVAVMVVNDAGWVAFWLLFFRRVGEVRGWDESRALLLLAVFTTSAGLVLGFFSNARRVGQMAADGELDAVLALPVPPLAYLLVRQISPVNMGDVLFGIVLFGVTGAPSLGRTAVFVVCVASSAGLLLGFLVATGSLAFFVGQGETGEMGFHAILLLANYPVDVFGGLPKLVLYTAIPAAFVAAVPATLIESFDWRTAAIMLTAAALALSIGWAVFTLGLRRYSSGSLWTHA